MALPPVTIALKAFRHDVPVVEDLQSSAYTMRHANCADDVRAVYEDFISSLPEDLGREGVKIVMEIEGVFA